MSPPPAETLFPGDGTVTCGSGFPQSAEGLTLSRQRHLPHTAQDRPRLNKRLLRLPSFQRPRRYELGLCLTHVFQCRQPAAIWSFRLNDVRQPRYDEGLTVVAG